MSRRFGIATRTLLWLFQIPLCNSDSVIIAGLGLPPARDFGKPSSLVAWRPKIGL
ncbi:hypothetical protein LEP1GSC047_2464 [Leptospira inadai serovar Lyme str. 10]|uniref:Uncharacterized protein n=1 Tax=Leptospira inadai serovar Lyme str. 10 TaxID=1049790 RepID=V6HEC5_9LEPT|nr:hypothetical protein LEP1GSC047_2464 [Leptospira inadai serovar Lyme str. 10]